MSPSRQLSLVRKPGLLFVPPGKTPNSGPRLLGWVGSGVSSLLGSHGPSREECLSCLVAYKLPAPVGLVKFALFGKALGLFAFSVVALTGGLPWFLGSVPEASGSKEPLPSPSVLPCLPPLRGSRDRAACRKRASLSFPAMLASSASARHSGWGNSRTKTTSCSASVPRGPDAKG